jgi:predicted lipoprotein with Yx(FWY)xxD motif
MFKGLSRGALMVGAGFLALLAAARYYTPPDREPASDAAAQIPIATPPGITLQLRTSKPKARVATTAEWVYADSRGMTLYTYDKDTERGTACVGECAAAWPAALAPPALAPRVLAPRTLAPRTATQHVEWSLLDRAEEGKQWVHRGAPLYRFANDKAIGDAAGDGADGAWHAAVFRPGADMALPDGIAVGEIADAGGMGLVDALGLTLYTFDGNATHPKPACGAGDCARLWVPLEAPEIANPMGRFAAIAREDGISQWTYRGLPLYKFAADQKPGDVGGMNADSRFRVALIVRFFMPADATIRGTVELGNILVTRSGATLYQRDRVTMEELHPFRTDHGSPALGRALGTATCDEKCTKLWPPFTAPAAAPPCGFWDVLTRADGRRQWAYKGFALYTYAADMPGDLGGNAIYTLAQIGGAAKAAASGRPAAADIDPNEFVGGATSGLGVSAMFWHAVVP